jgi:cytochrome c
MISVAKPLRASAKDVNSKGRAQLVEYGAAMGSYIFETGKIAGGLLGALVLALALTGASNRIFAHGKLAKPGYVIATANNGPSAPAPTAAANNAGSVAVADKPVSAAVVNESRSADAGAPEPATAALSDAPSAVEKKAETDDAFEKGAVVAKAGPPLFAIVDRPKSSVAGLARSNSLRAEGANWTVDDLDQFLASPRGNVGGEADAAKRADMVEYLRRLSDHPQRGRAK